MREASGRFTPAEIAEAQKGPCRNTVSFGDGGHNRKSQEPGVCLCRALASVLRKGPLFHASQRGNPVVGVAGARQEHGGRDL